MTVPWAIGAGAERVQLGPQRQGDATFTVTNNGPVDVRAVLDVLPSENADRAWFTVDEPQRLVSHGGSATFGVTVAGVARRHEPGSAGEVISQSVPAGAPIASGDSVNLVVGVNMPPPRPVAPGLNARFPQGGASPQLRWEPSPEAARYRVEVEVMGCTRVPQPPGVPPYVSCDYTGVLSEEGTADGTSFQPAPLYFPPDDGFVLVWANGMVRWRLIPLDDFDNPGPASDYSYFEMTR